MGKNILIVDDDLAILNLLRFLLEKESYYVLQAQTGNEAMDLIDSMEVDAVVLDIMLPDVSGLTVLKHIRKHQMRSHIPVILVTGKTDEIDTVVGLEMGADDYIHKPFKKREFIARLQVLFRRMETDLQTLHARIAFDDMVIMTSKRKVLKNEEVIPMSPKEYELLLLLISTPGKVFSRDEIMDRLWSDEVSYNSRTVDVHIRRIRSKIETDSRHPKRIETIRGFGYQFTKY